MKKLLLIISLVTLLVLGITATTLASAVYLDYGLTGVWLIEDDLTGDDDGDASCSVIGANITAGKFNIGLDYATGEWEEYDYDFNARELKTGYRVAGNDRTQFYIGLGYLNEEIEAAEFNGLMVELDLDTGSDKVLFEAAIGLSLNGEADFEWFKEDALLSSLKLRLTFLFSENFGLALGYHEYDIHLDNDYDTIYATGLLTLGITYKF